MPILRLILAHSPFAYRNPVPIANPTTTRFPQSSYPNPHPPHFQPLPQNRKSSKTPMKLYFSHRPESTNHPPTPQRPSVRLSTRPDPNTIHRIDFHPGTPHNRNPTRHEPVIATGHATIDPIIGPIQGRYRHRKSILVLQGRILSSQARPAPTPAPHPAFAPGADPPAPVQVECRQSTADRRADPLPTPVPTNGHAAPTGFDGRTTRTGGRCGPAVEVDEQQARRS